MGTIHTRIISFYASPLHGPKQTFYCSARKFNIGAYEPPPRQLLRLRGSTDAARGAADGVSVCDGDVSPEEGCAEAGGRESTVGAEVGGQEWRGVSLDPRDGDLSAGDGGAKE